MKSRPTVDWARLARATARAGNDTRHWISYGTVATVGGDDGTANYSDTNAVVISPASIDVDVILEPIGYPVTCQHGMQAGDVFIATPIRPGDQVIVAIPEGDPSAIPRILAVVSGASAPGPVGDDDKPIFKNDRALIFARNVPVDIRTAGGGRVLVDQDGNVVTEKTTLLGGADADQQVIKGNEYTDDENTMLDTIGNASTTAAGACSTAAAGGTLVAHSAGFTALATAFNALAAAIQQFRAVPDHLSDVTKTK